MALAFGATIAASPTPAEAGCPPQPPTLCGELVKSKFAIDSYGNVSWRGSHGPATKLSDFGNPETTSHYFMCAWDESGLIVAADIAEGAECPGGSCWSSRKPATLRFRDPAGNNSDLRALDLTASKTNRTKVRAETFVIGGINLPLNGGVLVQLFRSDSSTCFESLIPADAFTLNHKNAARAKAVVERQR